MMSWRLRTYLNTFLGGVAISLSQSVDIDVYNVHRVPTSSHALSFCLVALPCRHGSTKEDNAILGGSRSSEKGGLGGEAPTTIKSAL